MDIQKINWKIYFENPEVASPDIFFKVFNQWIPNSPEIFVDVADYQHVHDGPWTILIGHYTDYALDHTHRRLGFQFNRKQPLTENNPTKIQQTLREFLQTCKKLISSSEFHPPLKLNTNELLFMINDRALSPNNESTWAALQSELKKALTPLYGEGQFSLSWLNDPKQRFSVMIKAKNAPSLDELISRLG
ncbi:MAG: hypothetical protein HYU97_02740 [Deltaproteobacteria bacterium]|nr:hypothetical protein [Deltaproteobacteria bacterium]